MIAPFGHDGWHDGNARLCRGVVVHKRLRPKPHAMRYNVFTVMLDVDCIAAVAARTPWLGHNRFNLISFYDRDHLCGTGEAIGDAVRRVFREAGHDVERARILLLCYPRLLGYVFNPLSVFLLVGESGAVRAVLYEVNNTFGERKSYVVAAGTASGGVYAQACDKELYVSPFTPAQGRYGFRLAWSAERVLVGVHLSDSQGPLLKTHFNGTPALLTGRAIVRATLAMPFMTAKVMAGIHIEAVKLWFKGVPLVRRHRSPVYSVTVVSAGRPQRAADPPQPAD